MEHDGGKLSAAWVKYFTGAVFDFLGVYNLLIVTSLENNNNFNNLK